MERTDVPLKGEESTMEREEKLKALDAAVSQIEKAYGKGSIMKLGSRPPDEYRDYTYRFFKS